MAYRVVQRFTKGNDADKLQFIKDVVEGRIEDGSVSKFELINVLEWTLGKITLDEDDGK